jgi:hypothetical protein
LNPREITGQAGAMHFIFRQPLGSIWLGLVAIGLICFGIFSLVTLRYGKVPVDRVREVMKNAEAAA